MAQSFLYYEQIPLPANFGLCTSKPPWPYIHTWYPFGSPSLYVHHVGSDLHRHLSDFSTTYYFRNITKVRRSRKLQTRLRACIRKGKSSYSQMNVTCNYLSMQMRSPRGRIAVERELRSWCKRFETCGSRNGG
jgi:hypothetical protein